MNNPNAVEILVVEDNPQDLELTLRVFRQLKLSNRVHVAHDGAEALALIFGDEKGTPTIGAPRVIVLDLKLPKVDGLDVLRHLKGDPRTQSIPVVVLTASREQRDQVESYKLGVNSYLVKPVNFERFADAVHQLGFYWLLHNQPPVRVPA